MPKVKADPSVPVFEFEPNPDKPDLSATTLNIYKNCLNKITADSYKQSLADKRKKPLVNKKQLLAKGSRVVDIINRLAETRQAKCQMYSAVFYAIGKKNLNKNKKMSYLTDEFRKIYNTPEYEEYKRKKATDAQDTTPAE